MLPTLPQVRTDYPRLQPLADHINAMGDRSNQFLPAIGGSGVGIESVPGAGSRIVVDMPPVVPAMETGIVLNSPPGGGADTYTDNRYWVKFAYLNQATTSTDTTASVLAGEDATALSTPFTATNLYESTTHRLTANTPVGLLPVRGRSTTGRTIEQWIIVPLGVGGQATGGGFWAKIGSASLTTGHQARWDYPFVEIDPNAWLTDGEAVTKLGGVSSTGMNTVESLNSSTGIGTMGSGSVISSDDFANSIKERPIPANAVVWMRENYDCNGDLVYKFEGWNKKAECPA